MSNNTNLVRINHQSDFTILYQFKDASGALLPVPDYPFQIVLWSKNKYTCSFDGTNYVNCQKLDDNSLLLIVNNAQLGVGQLMLQLFLEIPNGIFPDGYQNVLDPQLTDILLWNGRSDDITLNPTIYGLIATLIKGVGVIPGGLTGQFLRKKSNTDYDMEWGDTSLPTNTVRFVGNQLTDADGNFIYPKQVYNILYADLVALRSAGNLEAGYWYRITDYVTQVATTDTVISSENGFDILVQAESTQILNENCLAIPRINDNYFVANGAKLEKWELKYSLTNDQGRYGWASPTGKGVIYYLKDEWGNEAGYDFKNIKFKRYAVTATTDTNKEFMLSNPSGIFYASGLSSIPNTTIDSTIFDYYYTFHVIKSDGSGADASLIQGATSSLISNNIIENLFDLAYRLPNNIFVAKQNGMGVYRGYSNNYIKGSSYQNTFSDGCNNNQLMYTVDNVVFGPDVDSCTIGNNVHTCSIAPNSQFIVVGDNMSNVVVPDSTTGVIYSTYLSNFTKTKSNLPSDTVYQDQIKSVFDDTLTNTYSTKYIDNNFATSSQGDKADRAVQFVSQTLTAPQQTQARTNINASSQTDMVAVQTSIVNLSADVTNNTNQIDAINTNIGNIWTNITTLDSDVASLETNKVDKVAGKGLSSNDFTDAYITQINATQAIAEGNTASISLLDTNKFDKSNVVGVYTNTATTVYSTQYINANTATSIQGGKADTAVQSAKVGTTTVTKVGTELEFPAYPTSLPANGGNADTIGGKSPSDFATSAQGIKADNAVQFVAQTLTASQQSVARGNINAQIAGDYATKTEAQGYAGQALIQANDYTDQEIVGAKSYADTVGVNTLASANNYTNTQVATRVPLTSIMNVSDNNTNKVYSTNYVNNNFAPRTFVDNLYFNRTGATTANLLTTKPALNVNNYLTLIGTTNTTINWSGTQKYVITRTLANQVTFDSNSAFIVNIPFAFSRNASVEFGARILINGTQVSSNQTYGVDSYNGATTYTDVYNKTFNVILDTLSTPTIYPSGVTVVIEVFQRQVSATALTTRIYCGATQGGGDRYAYSMYNFTATEINTSQIANGAVTVPKLGTDVINRFTALENKVPNESQAGKVLVSNGNNTSVWLSIGENMLAYGIQWDLTIASPLCTRIGNLDLHRQLPIQNGMKRCLLNTAGEIISYLDPNDSTKLSNGDTADLSGAGLKSGTGGHVMVEIPAHYRRFSQVGTVYQCWLSQYPLSGYEYVPKTYRSAYEATVDRTDSSSITLCSVVNTTANFRGGNNTSAWDGTYRSLLGMPASNINLTNFRTYARNNGSAGLGGAGWNCDVYEIQKTCYWLYCVEYANFNSQDTFNPNLDVNGFRQGGLGDGVTTLDGPSWANYNNYNPFIPCGYTNSLGNNTGVIPYSMPPEYGTALTVNVPSYRGLENIFGHIWSWLDGCKCRVQGTTTGNKTIFYSCLNPSFYQDTSYDFYTPRGYLSRNSGYTKAIALGDFGENVPLQIGGSSSTYFCDNFVASSTPSTSEIQRNLFIGGAGDDGVKCGISCFFGEYQSSTATTTIGSRLCFIPQ